ncbi:MAG TPA: MXAN_5187 C-terminal domain-containing protein [Candidatus Saccharimonadales bacterium]|jgi:hypothetical protein|nr:MXAN_5187 C-terminal domain-containing protein [Candidatus Saccharimonadales bacterium]
MSKSVDEDLAQLERDIRQLKIEYEQYFGGGKARPPAEVEWRIETCLKRYSDRGAQMNYGQRFRYGNLTQMYSKFRDMFRKRMKQREEGTVQRHFGAAAREIEAERARKRAQQEEAATKQFPFAVSWSDPDTENKKVEQLFTAFGHAKAEAGEDAQSLTMEVFQRFVRQKTAQLKKQQNANEVEYVVTIEGNQARLKARVKS